MFLDDLDITNVDIGDSIQEEVKSENVNLSSKDIAIIGIDLKLSDAEDLNEFWENLKNEKDSIKELSYLRKQDAVTAMRFIDKEINEDDFSKGAFFKEVDKFDYSFFNISPKEASLISPDHRLFIESVWKALEDAGYTKKKLNASKTGIYMGYSSLPYINSYYDYSRFILENDESMLSMALPGNLNSMIASRISHLLNLKGPSLTIDTACSSSLVAVHMACQAIKNKECDMAIAGSVKIDLFPLKKNKIGIESSVEKARTFDDSSDGTGKGEGVAAIILKDYDKAVEDNDYIYAKIKGSAINHDGTSIGLTAPNASAQRDVIISAWKNAGIDPNTIQYIEAHGTGTKLGDPIEIEGITKAFSQFTNKKQFCAIGALKSNIGHLDHASGIMGLIKTVMILNKKHIPASLNFEYPNSKINFEESPVYVNTKYRDMEKINEFIRCGVSAFGLSGTNCHIVLEEENNTENNTENNKDYIFKLSAKSEYSLNKIVEKVYGNIQNYSDVANVCYTADACRMDYGKYKYALIVNNLDSLKEKLQWIIENPLESNLENCIWYGNKQSEDNSCDINYNNLEEVCNAYTLGYEISWDKLFNDKPYKKVTLPTYQFDEKRCWLAFSSDKEEVAVDIASIKLKGRSNEGYTETERRLSEVWSSILGYSEFNIDDDFYDLGGDSIIATRLVNEVNKSFNKEIKLVSIMKNPTIEKMAKYIDTLSNSESDYKVIATETKEKYELANVQKQVYSQAMFNSIGTALNTPIVMEFEKLLDPNKVQNVINKIVENHSILRTNFMLDETGAFQKINNSILVPVVNKVLSGSKEEFIKNLIVPFNLEKEPLIRVFLIKDADSHILVVDMHHIITDGTSIKIFIEEFRKLYEGEEVEKETLEYKDFIDWEKRYENSDSMKKQKAYWSNTLSGDIPVINLPYIKEHSNKYFLGDHHSIILNKELNDGIKRKSKTLKVTPGTILFSAYVIALSKYADQDDIIVSTTVSGRNRKELEDMLGVFINLLPVRNKVNKEDTLNDAILKINDSLIEAYENQDYSYINMIDLVRSKLDKSRNPLFDTGFILHNEYNENDVITVCGNKGSIRTVYNNRAQLDIKLDIFIKQSEEIMCMFEYKNELFEDNFIEEFANNFKNIINLIIDNVEEKIKDIRLQIAEVKKTEIAPINKESSIPVVVSSTFTAEPIEEYMLWLSNKFGIKYDINFTDYNQVFMELYDENSMTSKNIGINLLLIRFEDWFRHNKDLSVDEKCKLISQSYSDLVEVLKNKKKVGTYLIAIMPSSDVEILGDELYKFINEKEQQLKNDIKEINNVHAIDMRNINKLYGISTVHDLEKDKNGHIPYTNEYYMAMAMEVTRNALSWKKQVFKVIALDCDNTIWKGICGEENVVIDKRSKTLQQFVLDKTKEGMIIVLCSKNNEKDVWNVFDNNKDMCLSKDNIADWRINWNSKSDNIKELAKELNLGLESFIFIDDSYMECMDVMENCPEVFTVNLPQDIEEMNLFLNHIWPLDRFNVTQEDKNRTSMYIEERKRNEVKKQITNSKDYLLSLNLNLYMDAGKDEQIPRISQLTQRTNQFNLSTIRRTEEEITELLKDNKYKCWTATVDDKFGKYGLVGVVITKKEEDILYLDTFLMSCRVLGRTVEDAIISQLNEYCKLNGINKILAKYVPSKKNAPVKQFFDRIMTVSQADEDGSVVFEAEVSNFNIKSEYVKCHFEEEVQEKIVEIKEERKLEIKENKTEESTAELRHEVDFDKWKIKLPLSDKLIHRGYYLPLEYPTAEQLISHMLLTENKDESISSNYVAPRDEKEELIAGIWREVLKKKYISIYDKFFSIGGTSLLAIQLESKLALHFECELSHIFTFDTIASFAENMELKKNYLFELFDMKAEMGENIEHLDFEHDPEIIKKLEKYSLENNRIYSNKYDIINNKRKYKNILITGGTGYLGTQLIYSILHSNKESNIHLIIRSNKNKSSLDRVIEKLNLYYGEEFYKEYKNRIFVYDGDLTKDKFDMNKEEYNLMHSKVDCIINSAANVTHYGKYEDSYGVNVQGVKNLIDFARDIPDIVINHISTLLVAFGVIEGVEKFAFTEDDHNVGQKDNNIYFRTKLEAEEIIEDARKYGIKTNIFRVGSLVYNSETLKFQDNIATNALYSMFKSFLRIKMVPSFKKQIIDFSFVDKVAEAITLIYDKNELMNGTYHVYNQNKISTDILYEYLREYGYEDLKLVKMKDIFDSFDNEDMKEDVMNITIHGGLIGNIRGTNFEVYSDRTQEILKMLGFTWDKIEFSHIVKLVDYCREVGFLE